MRRVTEIEDLPKGDEVSRDVSGARRCILVSSSCTTGWFDWIHGELWLCSEGLLRRSLGISVTMKHALTKTPGQRTVDPDRRPESDFSSAELVAIQRRDSRNRWVEWDEVAAATLKRGIIDHSLHIGLRDGRKVKFLWLKSDGGYDLLGQRLAIVLGERLSIVTRPVR
jgi:hypothetical protein